MDPDQTVEQHLGAGSTVASRGYGKVDNRLRRIEPGLQGLIAPSPTLPRSLLRRQLVCPALQ